MRDRQGEILQTHNAVCEAEVKPRPHAWAAYPAADMRPSSAPARSVGLDLKAAGRKGENASALSANRPVENSTGPRCSCASFTTATLLLAAAWDRSGAA